MSKLAAFFDKGKKKKVCKASSVLNELSADGTSAGGGGGLSSVGTGAVFAANGAASVLGGGAGSSSGPSGVAAEESVVSSSSSSVSGVSRAAGGRGFAAVKQIGSTQQQHNGEVSTQLAPAEAGVSAGASSSQTTGGLADEDTDLADWGVEEAAEIVGGRSKMSVHDGMSEALASKVGMVDASTLRSAKSEKKNLGWSAAPQDVTAGSRQRLEERDEGNASQLTNGSSPTGASRSGSADDDLSVDYCSSSSAEGGSKVEENNDEAASGSAKRSGGGGGGASSSCSSSSASAGGDAKGEKWVPSRLRLLKQQGSRAGPVDLALDKDPDLISSVRIAAQKQRVATASTSSSAKSASRQIGGGGGGGGEATTARPSSGGGLTSSPQTNSNIHQEGQAEEQQPPVTTTAPQQAHDDEAGSTDEGGLAASSAACDKEENPMSSSQSHLTGLGENGRRFDMLYLFDRIGLELTPPEEDATAEKRINLVDDQLVRSKFYGRKKLAFEQ